MHYLNQIVDRGFPTNISIRGSRGSDAGGLRKEFVTHLVQSLQPRLSLIEAQPPLITPDDPNADEKKEILRKFGIFLSYLYLANEERPGDPCLIGNCFIQDFLILLN